MESDKKSNPEIQKGWWSGRQEEVLVKKMFPDLGDLLTGKAPGRTKANEITGFLNNVGLGIQFAAVGARVYEIALERGLGRSIPTDWFLQTVHP